jgi:hypothetical protein
MVRPLLQAPESPAMPLPQIFLLCFAIGVLWSFMALLNGGARGHIGHVHFGGMAMRMAARFPTAHIPGDNGSAGF